MHWFGVAVSNYICNNESTGYSLNQKWMRREDKYVWGEGGRGELNLHLPQQQDNGYYLTVKNQGIAWLACHLETFEVHIQKKHVKEWE